jgi:hypothetical protein
VLAEIWKFISDPDHQATLAWIGGGGMTVLGGLWTAFTYFASRRKHRSGSEPQDSTAAEHRRVQVATGLAARGDMLIEGPVTINHAGLSKVAVTMAALGLLLLVYAILNSGDRISMRTGNYVGGDMEDSQVTIQDGRRAEP